MKYEYVVILRKNGEGAVDLVSALLCLASGIVFILLASGITDITRYLCYLVAACILGGLIFNAVAGRRRGKMVGYRFLLLLTALGWLMIPRLEWICLLFGVLAFLEHQTRRPLEIGFDRDRVVINSLIRRRFDWSAFTNVILRNGLLTLDFKNNRLIQREVADDDDSDADEEEFNAWCRDRLIAASA